MVRKDPGGKKKFKYEEKKNKRSRTEGTTVMFAVHKVHKMTFRQVKTVACRLATRCCDTWR